MGPNRRAQERERAAARAAAEAKRAEAERKAIVDAQKVVAIWNARQAGGRALWFYPTIGAAIAAGVPWLTFLSRMRAISARLTCARSTDTQAARSQGSFRHCRVGGARQTLRLHGSKC
jgi:hypothetical protein